MVSPPRSIGSIITGSNHCSNGGGVYFSGGTFTKSGGTISGNDVALGNRNIASKQEYAIEFQP
jgi:hypothetical protein